MNFILQTLPYLGILTIFLTLAGLTTLLERKMLARIQNRFGPNRVGPCGILQPLADGIKMLTKEDIVPRHADKLVHFLAPVLVCVPTFLLLAVLPVSRNYIPADLNVGVLFFFAAGSLSTLAIFMAGWSSRNKYSVLGGMRAVAQVISYEIPLVISAIPAVIVAGTMSTTGLVRHQVENGWHILTPWGLLGFLLFFIASIAELNRSPFDIPEGESEIIAGHLTEYSGFKYALFFLCEYVSAFAVSGLAVTLFLGGWHGWVLPGIFWFLFKTFALMLIMIWIRGTLPRMRVDHLMGFAWKFLLPLGFINLFAAATWVLLKPDNLGRYLFAWIVVGVPLMAFYYLICRALTGQKYERRTYRLIS